MVCQSPIGSHKDQTTMDIVRRFVAKKSTGQSSGLTKNMIPKPPQTFGDLAKLCLIFSELELFLWLQRKFPPGNMIEQQAANTLRERAIEYISDGLNNVRVYFLFNLDYRIAIYSCTCSTIHQLTQGLLSFL
jgi:hypothetical protein